MKILITVCRILVGSLFIVSGLIKVNDVLGFSYKLEEYFSLKALGFPELMPYVLPIAIFIVIGEVLLGVATLLGAWPKLTSSLILFMTLFFAWLTYYTHSCDPHSLAIFVGKDGVPFIDNPDCVATCGCFGDAIKLTPYQSFLKDIFLLPFVLPFFIAAWFNKVKLNGAREDIIIGLASVAAVAFFCYNWTHWMFPVVFTAVAFSIGVIIKIRSGRREWMMAIGILLICVLTQHWTLRHLPLKDYRPYAIGNNLIEKMKTAEELNLAPPQYMVYYTLKNEHTGDTMVVNQDRFVVLYKDTTFNIKEWKIQKELTKTKKVKDGYEPPITDFMALDMDGNDMTDSLLAAPRVFLLMVWDLKSCSTNRLKEIAKFANKAQADGIKFYGFTTASYDESENFRHEYQLAFPFLQGDEKVLKTMIRDNPGLLYLENATVVNMWSNADIPDYEEAKPVDFKP
ncbi:MAG: DoxX family protein [Crocinitomicaceae bacterium]|nr:DoxX family protein [Crocinitomicaceae bacterium]